ncbi:MAG: patatin-like phospholipase family protein [Bacteroidota bacterium]
MPARSPGLILALLLSVGPVLGQTADPEEERPAPEVGRQASLDVEVPVDDRPRPFVMVSSGGISKGAYQAGVNWAVLDLLRGTRESDSSELNDLLHEYELVATTGASAGNVNSILATIEWAEDEAHSRMGPSSSLFWQVWTGIGINELLPEYRDASEDRARRDVDAVLSRKPLETLVFDGLVQKSLGRASLRLSRPIPTGITMTSQTPRPADGSLGLERQRMATVFQTASLRVAGASGAGGVRSDGLAFEPFRFNRDLLSDNSGTVRTDSLRAFGEMIFPLLKPLARDLHTGDHAFLGDVSADPDRYESVAAGSTVVGNENTIRTVALASAAFPYAWAPVRVTFTDSLDHGTLFPRTDLTESLAFIDGGVFDNNPLGLALEIYEHVRRTEEEEVGGASRLNWGAPVMFFTDPDVRRGAETEDDLVDPGDVETLYGIDGVLNLASTFVESGRQYELETTTRHAIEARDWIRPTDRAPEIVGADLGAFAAFLARPFRVYDFYAGIYDGYVYAARRLTREPPDEDYLPSVIADLYHSRGLETRDPLAGLVFSGLYDLEFPRHAGGIGTPTVPPGSAGWEAVLTEMLNAAKTHRDSERVFESELAPLRARYAKLAACLRGDGDGLCPTENSEAQYEQRQLRNEAGELDRPGFLDTVVESLQSNRETRDTIAGWSRTCEEKDEEHPGLKCPTAPHVPSYLRDPDSWTTGALSEVLNYRTVYEPRARWRTLAGLSMAVLNAESVRKRPGLRWSRSMIPYYRDGIYEEGSYMLQHRRARALLRNVVPSRAVVSSGPQYVGWTPSINLGCVKPGCFRLRTLIAPYRSDVTEDLFEGGRTQNRIAGLGLGAGLEFATPYVGFSMISTYQRPYAAFEEGYGTGVALSLDIAHVVSVGAEWVYGTGTWTEGDRGVEYRTRAYPTIGIHDLGGLMYYVHRLWRSEGGSRLGDIDSRVEFDLGASVGPGASSYATDIKVLVKLGPVRLGVTAAPFRLDRLEAGTWAPGYHIGPSAGLAVPFGDHVEVRPGMDVYYATPIRTGSRIGTVAYEPSLTLSFPSLDNQWYGVVNRVRLGYTSFDGPRTGGDPAFPTRYSRTHGVTLGFGLVW